MCGIVGVYSHEAISSSTSQQVSLARASLRQRGPNHTKQIDFPKAALGHTRLSIIDTQVRSHQPMSDPTGRYTVVYNGEIYNFKALREELKKKGINFKTESDTEVLLMSYIDQKEKCLEKLNGFFAFAIYDQEKHEIFLARDRYGIKPLVYSYDQKSFFFASEMKAINCFTDLQKEIDFASLYHYFQFTYIPAPHSIYKNIVKLKPGEWIRLSPHGLDKQTYYNSRKIKPMPTTYEDAKKRIVELLDQSVHERLVSDVDLGTFLSGGIDSSIVTALASKHKSKLKTFSIGFHDNTFHDETYYAELVAKMYKTEHTVIKLKAKDILDHLEGILDYIDEPFADSSALPVSLLCYHVKKYVTVALSGDGADEVFAGYNKHHGEFLARHPNWKVRALQYASPLLHLLPETREQRLGNKVRQLKRFSRSFNLSKTKRYLEWCRFNSCSQVHALFHAETISRFHQDFISRDKELLAELDVEDSDFNHVLLNDLNFILPNDMLFKVDHMSMSRSLEVRVPFLDHHLVEYANALPFDFKINHKMKKRILQDAFKDQLPQELYQRPKQGFSIPLMNWFKHELWELINDRYLNDDLIQKQKIFNIDEVRALKRKIKSSQPGDIQAMVWSLIVFQAWWLKNFN